MSVTFFWPTVIQSRLASIAKERKNKLKKKKKGPSGICVAHVAHFKPIIGLILAKRR
jgi:hypothetical protein